MLPSTLRGSNHPIILPRGHMASALTARDYKNTGFGAAIFLGFYIYLYNDD
jgi:hypothetical protein